MKDTLARLNSLSPAEARDELLKCCGSSRWAAGVAAHRPYVSAAELEETADRVWWQLSADDWLEAFRAHPRIGERKAAAAVSAEARAWSEREQAGVTAAGAATRAALAAGNRAYEEKFGFIFIVCATGRTAAEMLALLEARLRNDRETELRVAAEEQRRITRLRLRQLCDS